MTAFFLKSGKTAQMSSNNRLFKEIIVYLSKVIFCNSKKRIRRLPLFQYKLPDIFFREKERCCKMCLACHHFHKNKGKIIKIIC
jgi:hypothetical protein